METTLSRVGAPDRFVACAGVTTIGTLLDQTQDEWQRFCRARRDS